MRGSAADGADLFKDVDWVRTKAYGLGLNGLYLNLQGRERDGIVKPGAEADALLAEMFPTRLRGSAMGVATICLWLANYAISQTFPMLDKSPALVAAFHHAFPFWLYALFCVVLFALVAWQVPETRGKTLEAIESYWIHRGTPHDLTRPGSRVAQPS